ncbi:MAG: glycosyltransferase [Prevotella sp.]|jgi:glycosyltransferase involved in cell wall biosynthesis|nr:glycosyltransferase [Prevotella sp.]
MEDNIIVSIHCTVFNHAPYLRQCLDGFVMQKTDFPFEAIVHDDASTDGSAKIIHEYAEKYPDIIKPIFEIENQYSKHDGSLNRIMEAHMRGKYIAFCEGDDYWIDPCKLQNQVDFLEAHKDYSMVCSKAKLYSELRKCISGETLCYSNDRDLKNQDIILKGGLYIPTCSILFRKKIIEKYPDYCEKCNVGDYPLQIMCAMKGRVRYFHNSSCVYRIENPSSWCGRQSKENILTNEEMTDKLKEIRMLEGYMNDFPKYKKVFINRIAFFLNGNFMNYLKYPKINNENKTYLIHILSLYNLSNRIDLFLRRIPIIRKFYCHIFLENYGAKNK